MQKLILPFLLFISSISYSQNSLFKKHYSQSPIPIPLDLQESAYGIFTSRDHGFVISGTFSAYRGFDLPVGGILKLDSAGNVSWSNKTNNLYSVFNMAIEDANYAIVGVGRNRWPDILVEKYDLFGNFLFSKSYGTLNTQQYATYLLENHLGNYVIVGSNDYNSFGQEDVILLETNSFGGTIRALNFGDSAYQRANKIVQTSDNGYLISGTIGQPFQWIKDGFIMKLDSSFHIQWSKSYNVEITSMIVSNNDSIILGGNHGNNGINGHGVNFILCKADPNGNIVWTTEIGTTGDDHDAKVLEAGNGDILLVGRDLAPRIHCLKLNSHGDTIWTRHYGTGGERINSITLSNDSNLMMAGSSNQRSSSRGDILLMKIDQLNNTGLSCNQNSFFLQTVVDSIQAQNLNYQRRIITLTDSTFSSILVNPPINMHNICQVVGLEDETRNDLKMEIFPNPTNGIIRIHNISDLDLIELYTLDGKIIQSAEVGTSDKIIIEFPGKSGLYVLKAHMKNGYVQTTKVIRE